MKQEGRFLGIWTSLKIRVCFLFVNLLCKFNLYTMKCFNEPIQFFKIVIIILKKNVRQVKV